MIRLSSFVAGLALAGAAIGVVWGDERDQICRPGYAASIRPTYAESHRLKMMLCERAGIEWQYCGHGWRLDHIVPLELGGDPVALGNLQLQPVARSHAKDMVENETKAEYCAGKITLRQAQSRFARD